MITQSVAVYAIARLAIHAVNNVARFNLSALLSEASWLDPVDLQV